MIYVGINVDISLWVLDYDSLEYDPLWWLNLPYHTSEKVKVFPQCISSVATHPQSSKTNLETIHASLGVPHSPVQVCSACLQKCCNIEWWGREGKSNISSPSFLLIPKLHILIHIKMPCLISLNMQKIVPTTFWESCRYCFW